VPIQNSPPLFLWSRDVELSRELARQKRLQMCWAGQGASQPSAFALAWAAFQASVRNFNAFASGSPRIEQSASSTGSFGTRRYVTQSPVPGLGDDNVLVTHFDRQISHVAAQNRVDPSTRRHACRQPFPHVLGITCQRFVPTGQQIGEKNSNGGG
jgi:hypothetical protein